ncbi:hypothetical protein NW757_013302 [Fusarium falciforme]|nr:hypothetical protein NW757_013302 [Fusarium falciforme]
MSRRASVFVNDDRNGGKDALATVESIRSRGGTAVANGNSVLAGDAIIETAIATFGSIDILINATVYTPPTGSIADVNSLDWEVSKDVQIKGSYKVIKRSASSNKKVPGN